MYFFLYENLALQEQLILGEKKPSNGIIKIGSMVLT